MLPGHITTKYLEIKTFDQQNKRTAFTKDFQQNLIKNKEILTFNKLTFKTVTLKHLINGRLIANDNSLNGKNK